MLAARSEREARAAWEAHAATGSGWSCSRRLRRRRSGPDRDEPGGSTDGGDARDDALRPQAAELALGAGARLAARRCPARGRAAGRRGPRDAAEHAWRRRGRGQAMVDRARADGEAQAAEAVERTSPAPAAQARGRGAGRPGGAAAARCGTPSTPVRALRREPGYPDAAGRLTAAAREVLGAGRRGARGARRRGAGARPGRGGWTCRCPRSPTGPWTRLRGGGGRAVDRLARADRRQRRPGTRVNGPLVQVEGLDAGADARRRRDRGRRDPGRDGGPGRSHRDPAGLRVHRRSAGRRRRAGHRPAAVGAARARPARAGLRRPAAPALRGRRMADPAAPGREHGRTAGPARTAPRRGGPSNPTRTPRAGWVRWSGRAPGWER